MCDLIENFIYCIGFYALTCYLYDNLKSPATILYADLRRRLRSGGERSLRQRYGDWAAITGATDGIGRAYAEELAGEGFNVLLISRSAEKLQQVAQEIESQFKVATRIIVADFTHGPAVYEQIEKELKGLPVGIWVNNAGQFPSLPGPLANYDAEELWRIIYVNVAAVTQLSRLVLQRMHKAYIKGAIVNISSGFELFPAPLAAIYAASKAYTRSLTLALQYEAQPLGVRVQLVSPGFVLTKMNTHSKHLMRHSRLVPLAQQFAHSALATLRDDVEETTGYFWHGLQTAVLKLFPARLNTYCCNSLVELLADELKQTPAKA